MTISDRLLTFLGLTAAGLCFYLLASFYLALPAQWIPGSDLGGDLKQFYAAGEMLQREGYHVLYRDYHFGRELYRCFEREEYEQGKELERFNFRYSPLFAWLPEQLLVVPYALWVKSWFWISLFCAMAALWLLVRGLASPAQPMACVWPLLLSFAPLTYTLGLGQNTCLTFLILCGGCYLLRNGCDLAAGLVFSCTFYKPQFMVCGFLLMLLAGQRRFCAGLAVGGLLWTLLSLWLCGWASHLDWMHSLWEILRGRQSDEMATNIPWKGFVLTVLPVQWQGVGMVFSNALALTALAWLVWRLRSLQGLAGWSADRSLALVVVWWLIFTPHVKSYELVLGLAWWIYFQRIAVPRGTLLFWSGFFWFCGLLALTARHWQVSLVAVPLSVWLVATVECAVRRTD